MVPVRTAWWRNDDLRRRISRFATAPVLRLRNSRSSAHSHMASGSDSAPTLRDCDLLHRIPLPPALGEEHQRRVVPRGARARRGDLQVPDPGVLVLHGVRRPAEAEEQDVDRQQEDLRRVHQGREDAAGRRGVPHLGARVGRRRRLARDVDHVLRLAHAARVPLPPAEGGRRLPPEVRVAEGRAQLDDPGGVVAADLPARAPRQPPPPRLDARAAAAAVLHVRGRRAPVGDHAGARHPPPRPRADAVPGDDRAHPHDDARAQADLAPPPQLQVGRAGQRLAALGVVGAHRPRRRRPVGVVRLLLRRGRAGRRAGVRRDDGAHAGVAARSSRRRPSG